MNYPELYRRLAAEIQKNDGVVDAGTAEFVDRLVDQLRRDGWYISQASRDEITVFLAAAREWVETGVKGALSVGADKNVLGSEDINKQVQRAFVRRWPDGINLSDRLWNFDSQTRQAISGVIKNGARNGAATGRVVMDMQRTIERVNAGQRFSIVQTQQPDWVEQLHEAGQNMIQNPATKNAWRDAVENVRTKITLLSETGSRSAAEQVLKQIQHAVDTGREQLLDEAVRWWVYERQLNSLKRIVRTEMATAMHRAVIDSTIDDEDIIGYQWRLSSSHPRPDICDYYANIDMGLGRGVWSKDAVPHEKAHPHCMCLLIPRVTPVKRRGKTSYAEFIDNASEAQQKKLLPKWAQKLRENGVSTEDLVRPDGLWSVSKKQMEARLGKQRFDELMQDGPQTSMDN